MGRHLVGLRGDGGAATTIIVTIAAVILAFVVTVTL